MAPAQSQLLSLTVHSKWSYWRPRKEVGWTTASAVHGLNGVWSRLARRGAVMEGLHQASTPKLHFWRSSKWSGVVRTPATSWQRGKHRTRMGETENRKEVCEHGRERKCTPWQRGNLEKPPGWTGEFALMSYRKSGRQRVSLHGGAHLLLTALSPQSRLFSIIRAYQQQAGTQRSGPVPQNKLSLLSSCRAKVQDVLRGGSPRRTPISL